MANDLPTPKDTLIARYAGPIQVGVTGDPGLAGTYVNIARGFLGGLRNSLALGGISDGARHVRLMDGTTISVARVAGMDLVRIDVSKTQSSEAIEQISRFFLESGFIQIEAFLQIREGQPVGIVFYSQHVLDVYDRWDEEDAKFADHPINKVPWLDFLDILTVDSDGEVQKAGECPYRFDTRTYEPRMDSDAVAVMPIGQGKQLAWLINDISAATGKMLLMMQVQLGRYHKNGENFLLTYSKTPTLFVTHGIMTLSDSNYLLLRISVGSVFWKPLTVNDQLRKMLIRKTELADHGSEEALDDLKRIESYLLTTAAIADDAQWTPADIDNPITVKGAPFYYGWKANWAGDEWSVVTTEPVYEGIRIVFHTSRRYRISLNEVRDSDDVLTGLNGSLELVEEHNYTPRVGVDNIWFPDPGLNEMVPFVPVTSASLQYPKLLEGDAPVYCWYDDEDNLVVVRHTLQLSEAKPDFDVTIDFGFEAAYGVYSSLNPDSQPLCSPGSVVYDDWKTTQPITEGGFYLIRGVEEHDSRAFTVDKTISNRFGIEALSSFSVAGSYEVPYAESWNVVGIQCNAGSGPSWHGPALVTTGIIEMLEDYTTTNVSHASVLVIPFLSSESGFILSSNLSDGTFSTSYQAGTTNLSAASLSGGSFVPQHAMFWRKDIVWGGPVSFTTDFNVSGETQKTEVKGWLFAKHINHEITLDDFKVEYRTDTRHDYNNSLHDYIVSVENEEAMHEGTAASLGQLEILFSPVLFGTNISTYPPVRALESVHGDLCYPDTLRDRNPAVSDELLPLGYRGLFSGWA